MGKKNNTLNKLCPSISQFKKLSKKNNLVVFSYSFLSDWLTPLSVYNTLEKKIKGESFLLESIEGQEKICRFSFLGFKPLFVFKSKGRVITVKSKADKTFKTKKDPLYELKKIMSNFKVASKGKLRFFGGFVGYIGYDTIKFYEPVGKDLPDTCKTSDSYFILPKFLLIFDHLKQQVEILSFLQIKARQDSEKLYIREKASVNSIYRMISRPCSLLALSSSLSKLKIKSNFKKKDFIAAVKKAKGYIKDGEVIQTVLSQRFSVDFDQNPLEVYRHLRMLNPSPYMFYLNFNKVKIVGSSPEMLLRCEKGELITRPIAGTRHRGKNEREDASLTKDLLADPKERAEHIMLVDLARNDLGKIAEKGTVNIPIFMKVERFSHVMHIVSEVRARLARDEDRFSSLISCFPAGTVSGAPKVRAMQIINELEPDMRGIYAGSVGYFSFTKSLDTCIIIRTIIFKGGKAHIQAGAGIVADSNPESEYQETINKAKAQILALKLAIK